MERGGKKNSEQKYNASRASPNARCVQRSRTRTSSLSFFVAPAATLSNPYGTASAPEQEGRTVNTSASGIARGLRGEGCAHARRISRGFPDTISRGRRCRRPKTFVRVDAPRFLPDLFRSTYTYLSPPHLYDSPSDLSGRARMTLHRHRVHFRGRLHHHRRRPRRRSSRDGASADRRR